MRRQWVSANGKFTKRFEKAFARKSKTKYAIAVVNGTAALESGLWALGIGKGDEVILPASTIISCAIAVLRLGATPIITEVDYNGCMTQQSMEYCLTEKTKAIMPVNLFGNQCKITHPTIPIIEDRSQDWSFNKVKGSLACYSLYANKLITSGEGGIIATNHQYLTERIRSYINLCHSDERFVHYNIGYNFRMSDIQAAVALAQLEQYKRFKAIKLRNLKRYQKHIGDLLMVNKAKIPWMYLVEITDPRQNIIDIMFKLKQKGIETRRFFYPLHSQPCLKELVSYPRLIPIAQGLWERCFYLPSGLTLTKKQIDYICKCLKNILASTI